MIAQPLSVSVKNFHNDSGNRFPVILQTQNTEENTSKAIAGGGNNIRATLTSSSAVADRPRDASCLSVVSFSSTIPSFIISYFGFGFTAAYN